MNVAACSLENLTACLLDRLRQVRANLGRESEAAVEGSTPFSEALDSMALVEFLALVADDCGVKPAAIEECVERRFTTVAELARCMASAGIRPGDLTRLSSSSAVAAPASPSTGKAVVWLAATAARLPDKVQPAAFLNAALRRPYGWLESHAGILSRRVWADQDPLSAAADAGRACLDQAGLLPEEVGALLVTSEAPPLLAGLAAALHYKLDLPPRTVALEIGGACTGFLAAWWTAQALLPRVGAVLVLAVEAPSRFLRVEPGASGEAAALFGDGAAACLLCAQPPNRAALPVYEVVLGADGGAGSLLRVERDPGGTIALHMEGSTLAGRALRALADAVQGLVEQHGLRVADLQAVVAHGGNGRLPALLARQLGLPAERVWSETPVTGNLGSASLPAAWAAKTRVEPGPVVWTSVGAGLTWAAALTGVTGGAAISQ